MKIIAADVFVTCPGRNFVTLQITTESGLCGLGDATLGNDSNLLIVFYVQIMPDDFVMQLHRF